MALIRNINYTTDAPSAEYPSGKYLDNTTPDAVDGTEFDADLQNDDSALGQSLLKYGLDNNIINELNGSVDSATDCQKFDVLIALIDKRINDQIASDGWKIVAKQIGNTTISTDMDTIIDAGFYSSDKSANLWTNIPAGLANGAFNLTVRNISADFSYATQTIEDYTSLKMFARTTLDSGATWSEWKSIVIGEEENGVIKLYG